MHASAFGLPAPVAGILVTEAMAARAASDAEPAPAPDTERDRVAIPPGTSPIGSAADDPPRVSAADRYHQVERQIMVGRARGTLTDEHEDVLLEETDELWLLRTEEERSEVDRRT